MAGGALDCQAAMAPTNPLSPKNYKKNSVTQNLKAPIEKVTAAQPVTEGDNARCGFELRILLLRNGLLSLSHRYAMPAPSSEGAKAGSARSQLLPRC